MTKHNVSVAYTTSPEVLRSVLINEEYFWVSSLVSVTKVSFFSLKEFSCFYHPVLRLEVYEKQLRKKSNEAEFNN